MTQVQMWLQAASKRVKMKNVFIMLLRKQSSLKKVFLMCPPPMDSK